MNLNILQKKFLEIFHGTTAGVREYFSPGRVNLIGEHIDYNGGFVFPAALTIGISALVRTNDSPIIRLCSLNVAGMVEIDLNQPLVNVVADGWGNIPKGVVKLLLERKIPVQGCEVLFSSTLPDASGLSSSAALETLMYFIASDLANRTVDGVKMANDCKKVENEFIGVNCGIMDQFAVAMGRADNAILLDCATQNYEYVPLKLGEYCLVIMNTKKRRELADSKYNERRAECDVALQLIQKIDSSVENLCQARADQVLKAIADPILRKRALHAVSEQTRVLASVEALKNNELHQFGDLLNASHQSLKDYYEVTGFELDTIVMEALKHDCCIGARMTGAGFGGCAIALVQCEKTHDFIDFVKTGYYKSTGLAPEFYVSAIGDGTRRIV